MRVVVTTKSVSGPDALPDELTAYQDVCEGPNLDEVFEQVFREVAGTVAEMQAESGCRGFDIRVEVLP